MALNMPNYGAPGYFHASLNMSPQRAAKVLVGTARAHHQGKQKRLSGKGIVKSAGSLMKHGGGKK